MKSSEKIEQIEQRLIVIETTLRIWKKRIDLIELELKYQKELNKANMRFLDSLELK